MTDISTVIVNWNTKALLLDCIRTILDMALEHTVEIIVVDNASTDGSAAAVAQEFPEVTVIRNRKNEGFAKANNVGIRAAQGKYVCLINSDVKLLDGCLDSMCGYMDEHPHVGILGPRILNKDLSLQISCGEFPSVWTTFTQALMLDKVFPRSRLCRTRFMNDFDHERIRDVEVLSGCFLMVRREALEKVGLLDERFFIYKEDVDWCKRFHDAHWLARFYPTAEAIHYGGASSSVTPARFLMEMEKANLQYWRKHYGWLAEKLILNISVAHYGLRVVVWGSAHLWSRGNNLIAKQMLKRYVACLVRLGGFDRFGMGIGGGA